MPFRIKKLFLSRDKRDDVEEAVHWLDTQSESRTRPQKTTTSMATEQRVKTNYPRPLDLYLKEEKEEGLKVGKFIGVLDSKWMFWEIPKGSGIQTEITESRKQWRKELPEEHVETRETWIVGRDKKHAHLTDVSVSKGRAGVESIISAPDSNEEYKAEKGHLGLGILILDSRPSFLEESRTSSEEGSSKAVFLAPEQTSHLAPYRVLYPSMSDDRWQRGTIGGVLSVENHKYGVIMGSYEDPRGVSENQPGGEGPSASSDSTAIRRSAAEGSSPEHAIKEIGSSRQASKWISASEFSPGKRLGRLLPRLEHTKSEAAWSLIQLNDDTSINLITVPGGFGEMFVLTDHGDPVSESKVWVVTATSGTHVGIARDVPGLWEAQMKFKLTGEDFGSWVIDASSRSLVGIIVDESARFCPIKAVFKHLSTSYRWWPENSEGLLPSPPPKNDRSSGSTQSNNPEQESKISKAGTIDGRDVWEMTPGMKMEWQSLEPRVQDLIRRTPPNSRSMPTIMIEGLWIGPDQKPTILISSSSKAYAAQLKKSIQRNGLLSDTGFQVRTQSSPIMYT